MLANRAERLADQRHLRRLASQLFATLASLSLANSSASGSRSNPINLPVGPSRLTISGCARQAQRAVNVLPGRTLRKSIASEKELAHGVLFLVMRSPWGVCGPGYSP